MSNVLDSKNDWLKTDNLKSYLEFWVCSEKEDLEVSCVEIDLIYYFEQCLIIALPFNNN